MPESRAPLHSGRNSPVGRPAKRRGLPKCLRSPVPERCFQPAEELRRRRRRHRHSDRQPNPSDAPPPALTMAGPSTTTQHKLQESSSWPGILGSPLGPVKRNPAPGVSEKFFFYLVRLSAFMSTPMQSYESVYRKHRNAVMRFAIQGVGSRDIAEELTAEAFLELHRHWETIDTERLPSWLFTVVKNRAADHWRRTELERRYFASEPSRPEQPHAPVVGYGLFDNQALKPIHRICLTLRYVHDMSLGEIAGRLGLSEVQVKGHLQYARGLLRKQLSGEAGK